MGSARSDLAIVRRPVPTALGKRYDGWLALRPAATAASPRLRIVFPHDGDVFALASTGDPLQRREQQLALRAVGPRQRVRWSANGNAVPLDASGTAFFSLNSGTWIVQADDGQQHDRVRIRVVPAPEPGAAGI